MAFPNPFRTYSSWSEQTTFTQCTYAHLPDDEDAGATPAKRRQPTRVILFSVTAILAVGILLVALKNGDGEGPIVADESISTSSVGSDSTPLSAIRRPVAAPRGVSEGVSAKSSAGPLLGVSSFSWTDRMLAWQRTAFHFQPKKNWMNDPNGPLFYKDWYHLFYQYNPSGAVWGNIVWGHAISRDMIHWRHLPIAMVADQWYDANGVWTGSATILPDDKIVMLYTGSSNESVQVQNLAYPADPSDPLLLHWVKYPGNPVVVPPTGIGVKDFRDPTTAWYTSEGKWRITIGSKINKTGISLVYDTEDFKSFKLLDGTLVTVAGTGMWECVDFYPISVVEENGLDTSTDGPTVKHVMKVSLDDDRNDYYALGTYFEENGKWIPDDPKNDVGIRLRYDYGTFYASKTFYDHKKKRRVLWGWITEKDSEAADVQKGWASLQAIPRTLLFDKKTRSNIVQWPVEEVENLRLSSKSFNNVEVRTGSVVHLNVGSATQLDIMAEFEIHKGALETVNGTDTEYFCSTGGAAAERGALGPFGLLILSSKDQSEQTPIYFYVAKGTDGNFKTFFCADHTRSSEATDVDKKIYGNFVPVLKGEKLSMRILVDHSIVESFAQGGRTCITSRLYPTKSIYDEAQLFLFNNATDANISASLTVWQMSSASIQL